jgi:hypothetical protein
MSPSWAAFMAEDIRLKEHPEGQTVSLETREEDINHEISQWPQNVGKQSAWGVGTGGAGSWSHGTEQQQDHC